MDMNDTGLSVVTLALVGLVCNVLVGIHDRPGMMSLLYQHLILGAIYTEIVQVGALLAWQLVGVWSSDGISFTSFAESVSEDI